MDNKNEIFEKIKNTVISVEPDSVIILYGSYARGENTEESDIDLLILINREDISREEKKKVKYPIYDIELETGYIISPLVLPYSEWENSHCITPFYEAIHNEGVRL